MFTKEWFIGDVSKGIDMWVNPIKGKHLTNIRASGSDDSILLNSSNRNNPRKRIRNYERR